MDDSLPATKQNLMHIWNKQQQAFDVIDLNTGLRHTVAKLEADVYQYNLQTADIICAHLREGLTLKKISEMEGMPDKHRIYAWLAIYPEFKLKYQEARKQRADYHADKVLEIAERAEFATKDAVPGYKLAADLHKWAAEKQNPEAYGPPKDASKGGGTSINIVLNTGVLDSKLPQDIIVDVHGNFKGFDDGTQVDMEADFCERVGDGGGSIELSRDRFIERDTSSRETEEESSQEDGNEEA